MIVQRRRSVEEAQNLATSVLPARLLVVNNPSRGCEHDVSELARREQVVDPLLNVAQLQIEPRGDNAALVDAASELHDDLAAAVVIDNLELANVACGGKCVGLCRQTGYAKVTLIPCFCMTSRNLTMTLDDGRIKTCDATKEFRAECHGDWSHDGAHLALATLLGIVNALEAISQHAHANHLRRRRSGLLIRPAHAMFGVPMSHLRESMGPPLISSEPGRT